MDQGRLTCYLSGVFTGLQDVHHMGGELIIFHHSLHLLAVLWVGLLIDRKVCLPSHHFTRLTYHLSFSPLVNSCLGALGTSSFLNRWLYLAVICFCTSEVGIVCGSGCMRFLFGHPRIWWKSLLCWRLISYAIKWEDQLEGPDSEVKLAVVNCHHSWIAQDRQVWVWIQFSSVLGNVTSNQIWHCVSCCNWRWNQHCNGHCNGHYDRHCNQHYNRHCNQHSNQHWQRQCIWHCKLNCIWHCNWHCIWHCNVRCIWRCNLCCMGLNLVSCNVVSIVLCSARPPVHLSAPWHSITSLDIVTKSKYVW